MAAGPQSKMPDDRDTKTRRLPADRTQFVYWTNIATRWMDVDIFGHVNNVNYYSYFDTLVNGYTMAAAGYDPHTESAIGLVIESMCRYHAPIGFPATLDCGLRVDHLGRSSVRYAIGLFESGAPAASAEGHFVHVYVDREQRKPTEIPEKIRAVLGKLVLPS